MARASVIDLARFSKRTHRRPCRSHRGCLLTLEEAISLNRWQWLGEPRKSRIVLALYCMVIQWLTSASWCTAWLATRRARKEWNDYTEFRMLRKCDLLVPPYLSQGKGLQSTSKIWPGFGKENDRYIVEAANLCLQIIRAKGHRDTKFRVRNVTSLISTLFPFITELLYVCPYYCLRYPAQAYTSSTP